MLAPGGIPQCIFCSMGGFKLVDQARGSGNGRKNSAIFPRSVGTSRHRINDATSHDAYAS